MSLQPDKIVLFYLLGQLIVWAIAEVDKIPMGGGNTISCGDSIIGDI